MADTKSPDEAVDQNPEPKVSQEEGELQKPTASPSRHQRHEDGDATKKSSKSSGHSPLHPYYQAKLGAKGNGVFSSCERKSSSNNSHGLAPSTPSRSRTKSNPRSNETPDRGASVPKFGEWDEADPSSADGFTQVFNLVREERQGGPGSRPSTGSDSHSNGRNQFKNNNSKGCCCFPWGGN